MTDDLVVKPDSRVEKARPELRLLDNAMQGLSPRTRKAYEGDWRRLGKWWEERSTSQAVADFIALDVGQARLLVLRYIDYLFAQSQASATVARAVRSFNSICKRLHFVGQCPWLLDVRAPKVQSFKDTRGPNVVDWQALLNACEGNLPKDVRDRAIVLMLRDAALRRQEICDIQLDDLQLDDHKVWVLGKGRREKVLHPIGSRAAQAVREWMKIRALTSRVGPLFCRIYKSGRLDASKRLTGQSIRNIVAARADRVHLSTRPHGLRHAGITAAANRWKGGVVAISEFARHSDPKTTMIYVDNVADAPAQVAELVANDEGEPE